MNKRGRKRDREAWEGEGEKRREKEGGEDKDSQGDGRRSAGQTQLSSALIYNFWILNFWTFGHKNPTDNLPLVITGIDCKLHADQILCLQHFSPAKLVSWGCDKLVRQNLTEV